MRRDPLAALTLWLLRAHPRRWGLGGVKKFLSAVVQPDLAIRKIWIEHHDELRPLSDAHQLGSSSHRQFLASRSFLG